MIKIVMGLLVLMLLVPHTVATAKPPQVIRLHVLAHDNTAAEQRVKEAVRDVLLTEVAKLLENVQSSQDAVALVTKGLPQFETIVSAKLRSLGSPHAVKVMWGSFLFPTRAYRQVVLPAGVYRALYIRLGAGQGSNWWCIMYPPLCYVPGVTRRGEGVRYEFALLNLLRGLWRRIVVN